MINQQAIEGAQPVAGPPAFGLPPRRITADSFRRLTAALKKTAVAVPALAVEPMAVAAPFAEILRFDAGETPTAEPLSVLEEVALETEEIAEPLTIQPLGVGEPLAIEPENAAAEIMIQPMGVIEPPSIQPLEIIEPLTIQAVEAFEPVAIQPEQSNEPVSIQPMLTVADVVSVDETPAPILPFEAPRAIAPLAPVADLEIEPELQASPAKSSLRKKVELRGRNEAPAQREKIEAVLQPATPEQEAESAELARSLLDMMAASASSGQPQERALASDTLLRMVPRLPLKSRITIAERLCLMEAPPSLILAKLIADPEIAVAGHLLEECSHITDDDLLNVIADDNPEKLRMVARRRRISAAVANALIATDDDSVCLTIARNLGAEIPIEGFDHLAMLAGQHTDILAPLCTRPDLPVHFAFELYWLAPSHMRRFLQSRFLTDSETLTKILKITMVTSGEQAESIDRCDPETVKMALAQAASGDASAAAATLAPLAQIDAATVGRILRDRQGEPLVALLKAMGFPRGQAEEVFEALKDADHGLLDPARDTEELQALFDQLSFTKARILLTYWNWSTTKTGPYAQPD